MRTTTAAAITRRTFLRSFAPSKSSQLTTPSMMSPLQRTLLTEERHPLERPNTYYSAALRRHGNRTPPSRSSFFYSSSFYARKLLASSASSRQDRSPRGTCVNADCSSSHLSLSLFSSLRTYFCFNSEQAVIVYGALPYISDYLYVKCVEGELIVPRCNVNSIPFSPSGPSLSPLLFPHLNPLHPRAKRS